MGKFYGVKVGRRPGIYRTWEECRVQVEGYSGAIYKSFNNFVEVQEYLGTNDYGEFTETPQSKDHTSLEDLIGSIQENLALGQGVAYVDGSYNPGKHLVGYGILFITGDTTEEITGSEDDEELANFRNVAGEIYGSVFAIQRALELGLEELEVYHDYSGIRHWALGEWKTNNPLTKRYYEFFKELEDRLVVKFVKVQAHSGDLLNEKADRLAKVASEI